MKLVAHEKGLMALIAVLALLSVALLAGGIYWLSLRQNPGRTAADQLQGAGAPGSGSRATQAPKTIASSENQMLVSNDAHSSIGASLSADGLPATGSPWQTVLPLGDGKYVTDGAKKGYIYLCHVQAGGQGAQGNPSWISGSVWYPAKKVSVGGGVSWPNAAYAMELKGNTRTVSANGFPTDHETGIFPIRSTDLAYQFDRNPNSIKAQSYSFSLPANPVFSASPNCIYGQVGIMNDGVPLFDGFDAEYRDAVAHETQDTWEGHPDERGVYHDHGFENGNVKASVFTVLGFAFDGFPITGAKLADGTYLTSNDLDECHGITSAMMLDGKRVTGYHYVLTQDFPYSVACFRGKSYEPKPGGGQSQAPSGSGASPVPPQAAIDACRNASKGMSCSFNGANGAIIGTCQVPPGQSEAACVPR